MKVRIGVQNVAREILIDVDGDAAAVQEKVSESLASGAVLQLTDISGSIVSVPGAALGYVEIGPEQSKKVGFGA